MEKQELKHVIQTIEDAKENETVNEYLLEHSRLSQHILTTMFHHHMIGLNQACARKITIVHNGDLLDYKIPDKRPKKDEPEDIPLDVLYEDDDLLVINKQKGLASQTGPGNWVHTLTNAMLFYKEQHNLAYLGLVHRLDQASSGCLLIAKTKKAAAELSEQLVQKICHRKYYAIVEGVLERDCSISTSIGRDLEDFRKMAVNGSDAKDACTHIRIKKRFPDYTWVECELETGRTHQIRVHLQSIGHPLVGDEIYGKPCDVMETNGQVLHAYEITFVHPSGGKELTIQAPLPAYWQELVKRLEDNDRK